ncbi:PspC domain-containing protein [Paenibacillus harenae]|uniref:Phage shock protein PspC (Stress-responsive transcriptional regulator) n=1 Tax=Paenibacillus harenae TaxID=306543 RepID=A0ABT9U7N0_PAEHA|nr:PspC domain-containing protein [Paenibacillus harenae]MDQ0063602.1 phage shock protein PspC (stress-responsive transcriptional regulator) [Paenibacillus harenae]MDQ0115655.1 phage shock protein PspC (stress-responsive transcriptional regulator) [Paenibacillus harenae]
MKKLFRSTTDSKLSGLCGGMGEWLGIDPTIIRLLVVIASFFSFGAVAVIYLIATLVVPKANQDFRFVDHY